MAARFAVGLALFALCHSSPVLKNGIEEIRDGRSLSVANGFASGGNVNMATSHVNGNYAKSTGSSNGAGALLARDGLYHQGQASANAQTYGNEVPATIDISRGYYHPLPVAQPAVITYNQNFPAEQLVYPVAPGTAESVANTNEASDSSLSIATNNGLGLSESNAQTSGNHGITATNTKTFNGYNSAASNANSRFGAASVSSEASGSGLGNGYAKSNAHTNGIVGVAPIANEPSIIAAKNQGFYTPAYGSASSNANVNGNGYGSATSSAKTAPTRRSISWRFGTAYDIPAGYGAIKSAPAVYQAAPVVYQAAPVVYHAVPAELSPSNAISNAYSKGAGSAKGTANFNGGLSSTQSEANSNIGGIANANADINTNDNGYYRSSGIGAGLKSAASTQGIGNAGSNANWNNGYGIAQSVANSASGVAKAKADVNNHNYGLYRSGENAPWGQTISNAQSTGPGQAKGNAQAFPSGLKVADSTASSNGWGFSSANSQSL